MGGIMMTACQKENLADIPEGAIRLTTEGFHNDGKTMVNNLNVNWVDGDNVIINGNTYTVTVSGGQAYIDGNGITQGPVYGYYGIPEWNISNGTTTTPTVHVPSNYTASYDADGNQIIALPMVAYSTSLGSAIQFKHLTAAIQVLVRNEIEGTTLVLDRVVVRSAAYNLFGWVDLTLADNTAPAVTVQEDFGDKEVTVNFTGSPTIPYYAGNENSYLAVQVPILPVGRGDITVEVYTHDVNSNILYNYTNTATIRALARNEMLTAGCCISSETGHVTEVYPLTFEAKTANCTVSFVNTTGATIEYSKNGGTWVSCGTSGTTSVILERDGDKVSFRGNNTSLATRGDESNACRFAIPTGQCYVYGNIMSLLSAAYGTANELYAQYTFAYLFYNNANLYSHPTQQLVLPATSLKSHCYESMFQGCTNLTSAPALPATELEMNCYQSMFQGCTNLTSAPVLPATTPAADMLCYNYMFKGCSRLSSITCLATDIDEYMCSREWVDGVASTGTFTKAASMNGWSTGSSGIPYGWTVVDYPTSK